jgi:hypothetical protein
MYGVFSSVQGGNLIRHGEGTMKKFAGNFQYGRRKSRKFNEEEMHFT